MMETHFPHNPMAQATKSTSSACTSCIEYYCEKCSVKLNIPRISLLPITLDDNGKEQFFRCDSCNCVAVHAMPKVQGTPKAVSDYTMWLEANHDDMLDMWESMGEVERFEKGGDFDTFMQGEYEDSRDFSNSGL